jgi:hypothetical protein
MMNKLKLIRIRDVSLRIIALILAGSDLLAPFSWLFATGTFTMMPVVHSASPSVIIDYPCLFGTIIFVIMILFASIAFLLFLNSFLRDRRWWVSLAVILVFAVIPFDWLTLYAYFFVPNDPISVDGYPVIVWLAKTQ